MGQIFDDITKTIGRTPLVRLNRVTAGVKAEILVKCEFFKRNPGRAHAGVVEQQVEPPEGLAHAGEELFDGVGVTDIRNDRERAFGGKVCLGNYLLEHLKAPPRKCHGIPMLE